MKPDEASGFVDGLRSELGEPAVVTGEDMARHLTDWRELYRATALAVIRPASTDDVAAVVRRCAAAKVAVVTQGGNTGLAGGTSPTSARPTIMLNLGRMNAIESIDDERWTMTVQAGVTIQAMHEAAAARHRLFAPDWGARGTATIGGGIATDAGGNNVLRYGNMRDQVLGLEVVLADGRVWDGLRALRKDSSGYDLKHLFIGSEGTLGVITRAVVKLRPPTPYTQSALAALSDLEHLMPLLELAHRSTHDMVTAFELIPERGMDRVCERFDVHRPLAARSDFFVLIKLASGQPVTDALGALMEAASEAGMISDAVVAATPDQEERLWMIRDELPPVRLYPETQGVALKADTAVPIDRIVDYYDGVRALAARLIPGAVTYGFGHVGDGNIHMYVMPGSPDHGEAFAQKRSELVAAVDQLTFDLGGTLSAEHGVGRDLRHRVTGQKPSIEWELMHSIKSTLDPHHLMNPGALLPEP